MAHRVFDVVAKDIQKEHVAEDMGDASVHEHRHQERQIDRNWRRLQAGNLTLLAGPRVDDGFGLGHRILAGDDLPGNGRPGESELVVVAKPLEEYEHEDV